MNMDMNWRAWQSAPERIAHVLFGQTSMSRSLVAALGVAVFAFFGVMMMVSRAQGLGRTTWVRILMILLAGIAALGLAMVPTWLYLVPRLPAAIQRAALWGAAALGLGVVLVPVQAWLLRASYLQGLISLVLSLMAAIAVGFLTRAVTDEALREKVEFGRIKQRTSSMDMIIGDETRPPPK